MLHSSHLEHKYLVISTITVGNDHGFLETIRQRLLEDSKCCQRIWMPLFLRRIGRQLTISTVVLTDRDDESTSYSCGVKLGPKLSICVAVQTRALAEAQFGYALVVNRDKEYLLDINNSMMNTSLTRHRAQNNRMPVMILIRRGTKCKESQIIMAAWEAGDCRTISR